MNYTFTKAQKKHLPEIRKIYNYYIKNTTVTYFIHPLSASKIDEMFFDCDEKYRPYVIFDNNTVIGFCRLSAYNKKEGYAHTAEISIYLDKAQTSKGIGPIALSVLEKKAKEENIHVLIAAVTSENEASIKVLQRNGFEQCGTYREVGYKFNRWVDDVYFQKIIA